MTSIFKEIKSDYVDDKGVVHIDGYRSEDDNAEGEIIAFIIKGEVYWRNPEFQFDPYVKEVVGEVVKEQKKQVDINNLKVFTTLNGLVFRDSMSVGEKRELVNEAVDKIINLM